MVLGEIFAIEGGGKGGEGRLTLGAVLGHVEEIASVGVGVGHGDGLWLW